MEDLRLLGLTIVQWSAGFDLDQFPFVADENRERDRQTIRDFGNSSDANRTHLHVMGDTGVGKSRLVFEALDVEGIRERAIVVTDYASLDHLALKALVVSEASYAILAVDDCTSAEAEVLAVEAAAARGRLRLITIGDRPSREAVADVTTVDVQPLAEGVITKLIQHVARLKPEDAAMIAELAQGFPKLAVLLAQNVGLSTGGVAVVDLLRGHRISELLRQMLPDEKTRSNVSYLALFERLGFDGELGVETKEVCDRFELGTIAFRQAVSQESARFVSTAGRYRRVTPRAFAVWLVRELIISDPAGFVEKLGGLSPTVFEAFRRQMDLFGGDPTMEQVLKEVAGRRADYFLGPQGLTLAGARFLNTLSYAAPDIGVEAIHTLVKSKTINELQAVLGDQQQQLVWALQHLLWFEGTFDRAAESLLALAVAETERHAGSAMGALVGAFQAQLGGTEVPLARRIDWLRKHVDDFPPRSVDIAVAAAGAGLKIHEGRLGGWRGARLQPVEWRPADYIEAKDARQSSWSLLMDILRSHPEVEVPIAEGFKTAFPAVVAIGIADTVLSDLLSHEWSAPARAKLAAGIRRLLALEINTTPQQRERLEKALKTFEGTSLGDRLNAVLVSEYWELSKNLREPGHIPLMLEELANELLSREAGQLAVERASINSEAKSLTLTYLFRGLGRHDTNGVIGGLALNPEIRFEARRGYLEGRVEAGFGEWADGVLQKWLEDPSLAVGVPLVVIDLPPTTAHLHLAVKAVEIGAAKPASLETLTLGGWVRQLSASDVELLLKQFSHRELEPSDVIAGLNILDTWLENEDNQATPDLNEAANDLIFQASSLAGSSEGPRVDWIRNRLADQLGLDPKSRLAVTVEALKHGSLPSKEDLQAIGSLAEHLPEETIDASP